MALQCVCGRALVLGRALGSAALRSPQRHKRVQPGIATPGGAASVAAAKKLLEWQGDAAPAVQPPTHCSACHR